MKLSQQGVLILALFGHLNYSAASKIFGWNWGQYVKNNSSIDIAASRSKEQREGEDRGEGLEMSPISQSLVSIETMVPASRLHLLPLEARHFAQLMDQLWTVANKDLADCADSDANEHKVFYSEEEQSLYETIRKLIDTHGDGGLASQPVIEALFQQLFAHPKEEIRSRLLLWMTIRIEVFDDPSILWGLRRTAMELDPKVFEQFHRIITSNPLTQGELPTRMDADYAAALGREDLVRQFQLLGAFPTEMGMVEAIGRGCANIAEWYISEGFHISISIREALIRFIGRYEQIGEQFTPYPRERLTVACSLLSTISTHGIYLYYDFGDTLCAHGIPSLLETILQLNYPISDDCVDFAASSCNVEVLNWYLARRSSSPSPKAVFGAARLISNLKISDYAVNMACYWGDLTFINTLRRSRPELTDACLNIAAYAGNLPLLKELLSIAMDINPSGPHLRWRWALKGGHYNVINFLKESLIPVTLDDLRAAIEYGMENQIPTLLELHRQSQLVDSEEDAVEISSFETLSPHPSGEISRESTSLSSAIAASNLPEESPQQIINQMLRNGSPLHEIQQYSTKNKVIPLINTMDRADVVDWLVSMATLKSMVLFREYHFDLILSHGYLDSIKRVLDTLQLSSLSTEGYVPSQLAIDEAASNGHEVVLQFCFDRFGLLPSEAGPTGAASKCHLGTVKWCHRHGIFPNWVGLSAAAQAGCDNVVNYLILHTQLPLSLEDVLLIVNRGNLALIRLLEQRESNHSCEGCARIDSEQRNKREELEMIDWEWVAIKALEKGSLSILQYLMDRPQAQTALPQQAVNGAVYQGHLPIFKWLASRKLYPASFSICENQKLATWLAREHPLYFGSMATTSLVVATGRYAASPWKTHFTSAFAHAQRKSVDYDCLRVMIGGGIRIG